MILASRSDQSPNIERNKGGSDESANLDAGTTTDPTTSDLKSENPASDQTSQSHTTGSQTEVKEIPSAVSQQAANVPKRNDRGTNNNNSILIEFAKNVIQGRR